MRRLNHTGSFLIALVLLLGSYTVFAEFFDDVDKSDWKDPRTRDEDLSHTKIKVLTKRVDGLYYYAYEITSPPENKGIITGFSLDISCDLDFSQVDFPAVTPIKDMSKGKHVPVGGVSIFRGNRASVMTGDVNPGEKYAFFMVSPAPPAERAFQVIPYIDNYGWRYDLYPDGKSVVDFIHRGTTLGPECTTDFNQEPQ